METNTSQSNNLKLFVCLYSDPNFFALNLLENLLAKNCLVNIITNQVSKWNEKTKHLNKSKFAVTELGNNYVKQQYNYAIYCGGFIKKKEAYKYYETFSNDESIVNTKSIVILPAESYSSVEDEKILLRDNLSVIYLGDIFGPRMDFESDLFISENIGEILYKRKLTVEIGEVFYPIFVADVAKQISKWLFSFGPYGKKILLLGPHTSVSAFWKINQKIIPDAQLLYQDNVEQRIFPEIFDTYRMECNLPFYLTETYKWISLSWTEDKPKTKPKVAKTVVKKKRTRKPLPKFVRHIAVFTAIILLFPFVNILTSGAFFYFAYKDLSKGSIESLENKMLVTKTLLTISKQESDLLKYIPFVGKIYKETAFISWIGVNTSNVIIETSPSIPVISNFFSQVLGNEIYDPSIAASDIKKTLESLYKQTSIIQVETKSSVEDGVYSAKLLSQKIDFERLKTLTSKGSLLADQLPNILGKEKKQSYLVLFQNNMELRPTGGFIGSFGVANFEGGRMNELTVNDVYSADGQLKGHVEPPAPIKNYLDEANWWLRDSNWDPDFPTSAQRAEWFLDKEIDQKVDGVIAIDLGLVRDMLKYTGPIFLPDFNLDISSDNLYEKTQEEVQNNFFPGTHKKASFLTALSRGLLAEVSKVDSKKKALILKAIFENLEGRHVQMYLHNQTSQNAINDIGWAGAFVKPNCGDKCIVDYLGLVEANLGVNKANYFITRNVALDVNILPDKVSKTLTLNIQNAANQALGLSGRYKVYIRLVIPEDSIVHGVKRIIGQSEQLLTTEVVVNKGKQEIGVITEVLGGQSQKIQFSWDNLANLQDTKEKTYGLFIRKQAGVENDSWTITAVSPKMVVKPNLPFVLTQGGAYTYNTVLNRDFVTIFNFKQ